MIVAVTVGFAQEYSIAEDSGVVIVCVELFSGPVETAIEVEVFLSTVDVGSAQGLWLQPTKKSQPAKIIFLAFCFANTHVNVAGLDYNPVFESPLTFGFGSTVGDEECISVSIVDDSIVEATEQFEVSFTSGDPDIAISSLSTIVMILDSDGMACKFLSV